MLTASNLVKSENILQVIEYDNYDETYQLLNLLPQQRFAIIPLEVSPLETNLIAHKEEQNAVKNLFRVVGNFLTMNAIFAKCSQELKIGTIYRGYFDFEPTEAIQHRRFPTFYPLK